MPSAGLLDDVQAALRRADKVARRRGHAFIDTPHLLLGLWGTSLGRFALAAFGVRAGMLRRLAADPGALAMAPAAPEYLVPGVTRSLSARAARAFTFADEFIRTRDLDIYYIDSWLLLRAIAEHEPPEENVLVRLGTDVAQMKLELWGQLDAGSDERGTPRLSAYHRARCRGLLGLLRRVLGRRRIRTVHYPPHHPVRLIGDIYDRALCREETDFVISADHFPEWISEEARRSARFNAVRAFRGVLDSLGDRGSSMTGIAPNWPDATTIRGGRVRIMREGDRIRVHVKDRSPRPKGPPQGDPCHLIRELVAIAGRRGLGEVALTRETLATALESRTAEHPSFDAGACYTAITELLCAVEQPRRWGGRPPMWVYCDRGCVVLKRRLYPWTRLALWWRGGATRPPTLSDSLQSRGSRAK